MLELSLNNWERCARFIPSISIESGKQDVVNVINYLGRQVHLLPSGVIYSKLTQRYDKARCVLISELFYLLDFYCQCTQWAESGATLLRHLKDRNIEQISSSFKLFSYHTVSLVNTSAVSFRCILKVTEEFIDKRLVILGAGTGVIKSACDLKGYFDDYQHLQEAPALGERVLSEKQLVFERRKICLLVVQTVASIASDGLILLGACFATCNVGALVSGFMVVSFVASVAVIVFEQIEGEEEDQREVQLPDAI